MKTMLYRTNGLYSAAMLLLFLLATLATTAHAALLDFEQFDYAGGNLSGQTGGTGWGGAWTTTTTTPVTVAGSAGSLSYPVPWESPATSPTTAGSRVSYGSATNGNSFRLLSTPINLSQDGNVMYVSGLFKKSRPNGDTTADNILLEFYDASANRRFGVGIEGTGDKPWLNANGSTSPATAVTVGDTYFMVAKIVSSAASVDTASLWVFGTSYLNQVPILEPTPTITLTESTGAILDRMRVRIDNGNTAAFPGDVDEIRIANTWQDAIGVPEPSSLAMLSMAMLAGMVRRRRA